MKFSEKLRLLRKKAGLTQQKFADAIGVSRQSVYKWEDGQSFPEIERLLKMKELFKASIDDMFDDGMSVSDDGTLKTNEEVEYENAHKKKRKPRKDKGIKTGIPPRYKNGDPVVRKKKVVEPAPEAVPAPAPAVEPVVAAAPAPVVTEAPVVETPVAAKAAAPAAPAAPAAAARPRFVPGFTRRDAQASARAAMEARRARSVELDDDMDLADDSLNTDNGQSGGLFGMFRKK